MIENIWFYQFLFSSFFLQRHSIHGMMDEENVIKPHQEITSLHLDEKRFLIAVERGDVASVRRYDDHKINQD